MHTTTSTRSLPFGDIGAPRDSVEYATAVKVFAQAALDSTHSDVNQLESCIDILRSDNRYRRLTDRSGHSFMSWEAFCVAERPFGLGYNSRAIESLISDRKKTAGQLAADPTVTPLADHGTNQHGEAGHADGKSTSVGSNQASYIVRRLKRDAPEIAEALARGDYPSARSAGIAAGIIKPATPLQVLRSTWKKATASERRDFLAEVSA
jgi:hypothetical protein